MMFPLQQTQLPIRLHVVSRTPGRIRLRIAPEQRQDEVMNDIKQLLQTYLSGIERVRTNTQTGSVTLYFSGGMAPFEAAFSTLCQSGVILSDIPTGQSTIATRLTTALAGINQRVNLATEGSMDLRLLFPLLLTFLALRQVFSNSPRLNTAPWYILAWYAFDSFMKLNRSQGDPPLEIQTLETEAVPVAQPTRDRDGGSVKRQKASL
ncbi:HMA2 domain-containing protein [Egbenema bharatensis]|uniref:HMA2 domain-containing protein n=1 Tax=Egbenema bharatensis TaxID=3463334 RepID=UPI003A89AF60